MSLHCAPEPRQLTVETRSYADESIYLLSPSPSVTPDAFLFSTSSSDTSCGGRCLTRLYTFSNDETFFFTTYDLSPAPGYRNLTANYTLYCVPTKGDCNAWVPFWRSTFFEEDGPHYAYSFGFHSVWAAFRDPLPLCFVWSPYARPRSSSCSATRPSNASLDRLQVFDNGFQGTFRDHLYTTLPPPLDYRFQLNFSTGFVVVDENSTDCECLVPLVQVFAESDYFPPNRDHKLVNPRTTDISLPYAPTGEIVFCASQYGACGATVPMRPFFNLLSMDTVYMFSNSPSTVPTRIPAVPSVLCYIWT
uniref:DUF3707 domain-containing protein n=1 Tax=Steinernema glaseri TaxID=37863 RepID=A0A1I7ZLN6_9BILA